MKWIEMLVIEIEFCFSFTSKLDFRLDNLKTPTTKFKMSFVVTSKLGEIHRFTIVSSSQKLTSSYIFQ